MMLRAEGKYPERSVKLTQRMNWIFNNGLKLSSPLGFQYVCLSYIVYVGVAEIMNEIDACMINSVPNPWYLLHNIIMDNFSLKF